MKKKETREGSWERLIAAAQAASRQAHAPYSGLHVGAALEGGEGGVHSGCNVENSSFGLSICAERAALFRAVADGERQFGKLVIFTADAGPLSPCGACRQVLIEFCRDGELPILSVGQGGARREFDVSTLLPQAFGWPAGEPGLEQEV
jgi:cytidine deaminase